MLSDKNGATVQCTKIIPPVLHIPTEMPFGIKHKRRDLMFMPWPIPVMPD
jgi:hypothetical protein